MGSSINKNYPDLSTQLEEDNKELQKIRSDGNCLFRAISHQVTGNDNAYKLLRAEACKYIKENKKEFSEFFMESESLDSYVERMAKDREWGDNYCISALAMKYKYKFIIYESHRKKLDICYTKNPTNVIYLAYLNKRHYNSVVNKGLASKKDTPCCA